MAKGPQNDKTGTRAQTGTFKSGSSKSAASKTNSAKPASAKKPARKAQPKTQAKSRAKAQPKLGGNTKTRAQEAAANKAALRAAFEKAMREIDEAEEAFDDALEDLQGLEDFGEGILGGAADESTGSSSRTGGFAGGLGSLGGGSQSGEMGNLLDFYSRMLGAQGGAGDDMLNEMTQGFGMVLGSGPAFAALESMLSNVSAQGAVLMNAVQTQRQLDQIGLCCTSECVKQLMSLNNGYEND